MPHTDTIPVSASITSVGKGVRYIGKHAYAFSGLVTNTSSSAETVLLDFTVGSGYILASLDLLSDEGGNSDRFLDIQLNGTSVLKGKWDNDPSKGLNPLAVILLPPLTRFVVMWGCTETRNMTMTMNGRVYGAE